LLEEKIFTFLVPHSAWKDQELDGAYIRKLVASYESDPELVQLPPVTMIVFPKTRKALRDVNIV
jgi:hypothetical protein